MSKIALSGPASGTATYTISAPTGATDRTITLPDVTGTLVTTTSGSVSQAMLASGVAGNGPAFSATFSGTQSVTSNTITKVTLNTETFDTNNNYDPTTNYRFTPTVAGYYQFSYGVNGVGSVSTVQAVNATLYKNGSPAVTNFVGGSFLYATAVQESASTGSILLYMNGSTDYVELYGKVIATSPSITIAFLTGFLARSAT